jgi:hypothetical protein
VVLTQYERIRPFLDERGRRLWATNEAIGFGKGGIRTVAEALRMSSVTIIAGVRELRGEGRQEPEVLIGRQRRSGGGIKNSCEQASGDSWSHRSDCRSVNAWRPHGSLEVDLQESEENQEELGRAGYKASADAISKILREHLGYALPALMKTREGLSHQDRNAQFEHLNQKCRDFQDDRGQPVISVDAKKKE